MPQSTFKLVLDAVQSDIRSLSLTDIDHDNVVVVKTDKERERIEIGVPGIMIMPFGSEILSQSGGTNKRHDIGYPVLIYMLDCSRRDAVDGTPEEADLGHPDNAYAHDERLRWRQLIINHFIRGRLQGINSIYTCNVIPQGIVDGVRFLADNLWKSALLLQFMSREVSREP